MGLEIERKYRVVRMDTVDLGQGRDIEQAYLANAESTVRVRLVDGKAFLTIKCAPESSISANGAIVCQEFEYPIPVEDGRRILRATPHRIHKTRHRLAGGVELDIFHERHEGLILAEFESETGKQAPAIPGIEWVEVSDDRRYSNAWMATHGVPPHGTAPPHPRP